MPKKHFIQFSNITFINFLFKKSILFIVISFFTSCKSDYVTLDKDWYIEKGKMRNNKKVGTWIYRYKNGEPFQVGDFKKGYETGLWKIYYENGGLRQVGVFKQGKLHGLWLFYYDNGALYGEGELENNNYINDWKWYYPNGAIHTLRKFENGKLMHIEFTKNSTGEMLNKGTLDKGNGTLLIYDTHTVSDSIIGIINYKNGIIVD